MITTTVAVNEVRSNWAEILNRVKHGNKIIIVEKHGKPAAVIIPLHLLELLEQYDDRG